MSKYPVRYYSSSKKAEVDIESMATPHIANAWRKARAVEVDYGKPHDPNTSVLVMEALGDELVSRGCTLGEDGQWTIPPKAEVAP